MPGYLEQASYGMHELNACSPIFVPRYPLRWVEPCKRISSLPGLVSPNYWHYSDYFPSLPSLRWIDANAYLFILSWTPK